MSLTKMPTVQIKFNVSEMMNLRREGAAKSDLGQRQLWPQTKLAELSECSEVALTSRKHEGGIAD